MFEQPEKSYSWWDYRMLGFQKNRGLRIDHILVSEAVRQRTAACHIDRAPRKNPQPSDHTPWCWNCAKPSPVAPLRPSQRGAPPARTPPQRLHKAPPLRAQPAGALLSAAMQPRKDAGG
jgi:hypothetical protein